MCYSAEVSFTVGSALLIGGAYTLKNYHEKDERMLALCPLLFGFQQISEGFVWLGINNPDTSILSTIAIIAKYMYLIFALYFWPVWIGASLLPLESHAKRKKFINIFFFIGIAVALYNIANTIYRGGYSAEPFCSHIQYLPHDNSYNPLANPVRFIYLSSIIGPFFISSLKRAWIVGALVLLAFIYAFIDECLKANLASIWCFWCAIISIVLYYVLAKNRSEN